MEANFKTIGAKAVLSFNDGTQQKFNDILSLCLYAFNKKITLYNVNGYDAAERTWSPVVSVLRTPSDPPQSPAAPFRGR